MCELFLQKDERNFHVWNYRLMLTLYLLELAKEKALEEQIIRKELDFVSQKIKENFSNYSALHFFTKYLELLRKSKQDTFFELSLLQEQVAINLEALYVSPNEQALWLF